ncbi:DNA replication licensing factor MCM8, partial [Stegodyphus mimosarum]
MSKHSQAKKLINLMTEFATVKADDRFTVSEIRHLAEKSKINTGSLQSIIEALNDQGFLIKKGRQLYQIQT